MRNFAKNKKYCGIVYVLIAGISIFIACTGNDDIEILNEMETRQTRCVSSILNLSSYEPSKWTTNDYEMMAEAAIRMGVSFSKSKNKYIYEASSGADVNIAERIIFIIFSVDGVLAGFNCDCAVCDADRIVSFDAVGCRGDDICPAGDLQVILAYDTMLA